MNIQYPKKVYYNKFNLPNKLYTEYRPFVESGETSDTNGTNRRTLYEEFIKYATDMNSKNRFETNYKKRVFSEKYPILPYSMRFFYRIANPLTCILDGELVFFSLKDINEVNEDNNQVDEYVVFAGTMQYLIIYNKEDDGIYKAIEQNDQIVLQEKLADSFDLYIQSIIDKGDILGGVMESHLFNNTRVLQKYNNEEDWYITLYEKLNENSDEEIIPIIQDDRILEHSYRIGWDYNTGHMVKVIYSLEGINVPDRLEREPVIITESTNESVKPQVIGIIDLLANNEKVNELKHGDVFLNNASILTPKVFIENGLERNWNPAVHGLYDNIKEVVWDIAEEVKVGQVDDYPVYKHYEKYFEYIDTLNRPTEQMITESFEPEDRSMIMMGPELRDRLQLMAKTEYIELAQHYKENFDPDTYDDRNVYVLKERALVRDEIMHLMADLQNKYAVPFILLPKNSVNCSMLREGVGAMKISDKDISHILDPNYRIDDNPVDGRWYVVVDLDRLVAIGHEDPTSILNIFLHEYGHVLTINQFTHDDFAIQNFKKDFLRSLTNDYASMNNISYLQQIKADAQYAYYHLPMESAANNKVGLDAGVLTNNVIGKYPDKSNRWIDPNKFTEFDFTIDYIKFIEAPDTSIDTMSLKEIDWYIGTQEKAYKHFVTDPRLLGYELNVLRNYREQLLSNREPFGPGTIHKEAYEHKPFGLEVEKNRNGWPKSKYNFTSMKFTLNNLILQDRMFSNDVSLPNTFPGTVDFKTLEDARKANYSYISQFEF